MGRKDLLLIGVIVCGVAALGAGWRRPAEPPAVVASGPTADDPREAARRVDQAIREGWTEAGLGPAASPAPDLAVARRLALALTGAIPSLEEIRRFEARPPEIRVDAYLEDLLRDRRTADYLAERLARAFVGTEDGPFLLFRRRRFTTWLSDALGANRPYDAIVRDLIAEDGLWTDRPATNFITVTRDLETERPDPERLAARVARAFLGVRLDFAQCHDHPFQPWTQADFRGLAAFFGGLRSDLRGVRDAEFTYAPIDRKTQEPADVAPEVPFFRDRLADVGPHRKRLADWVTDRENPYFARATVNRIWALLFNRPLSDPVDDLPADGNVPPALAILADDFATHGYDLHRLIRTIAATEAFRLDSAGYDETGPTADHEAAWAAFPLTPLRPEQVAGALFQAASLTTLDADSPWIVRLAKFTGRNEFVRRYGDVGEDEFDLRAGTIPQRLLLMNGQLVDEKTQEGLFQSVNRIAQLAPDDARAVETAYLVVLTRRPTAEETAHFAAKLAGTTGGARIDRLTDLMWTLLNSTEFSWNH